MASPRLPGGDHTKLKQTVTGRESHTIHLRHIPGADDVTTTPGIFLQPANEAIDLINAATVAIRPMAPLRTVHGPQFAVFISPFIPDSHAIFLQITHIGAAHEEPQQLVNDGAQMQFFRGETGEPFSQIKTNLTSENANGSRTGAILTGHAMRQHIIQQLEVLFHELSLEGEERSQIQRLADLCREIPSFFGEAEFGILVEYAARNIDERRRFMASAFQRAKLSTLCAESRNEQGGIR